MKWRSGLRIGMAVVLVLTSLGMMASASFADAPPEGELSWDFCTASGPGLDVAEAGVGLETLGSGTATISADVPGTVVDAWLFWAGRQYDYEAEDLSLMPVDGSGKYPDQNLVVNGQLVEGQLIGWESQFPGIFSPTDDRAQKYMNIAFGANIYDWVIPLAPGAVALEIQDPDPSFSLSVLSGAGVIVVYETADTTEYMIMGRAGLDFCYNNWKQKAEALTADPVVFGHGACDEERQAQVIIFSGDATEARTDQIDITTSAGTTSEYNLLRGSDGVDWDTLGFDVTVPAGSDSTSVQVRSEPYEGRYDDTVDPDSLLWTMALMRIPVPGEELGALGDYVWYDDNENGQQDPGEPGVPGATVTLYDCDQNLIATTTTDASGYYLFSDLPEGCYVVEFELPAGMTWTSQDLGDDASDSDADAAGRTIPINLGPGEVDLTWDAGVIPAEECLPCDGKVDYLRLQYLGADDAQITVTQRKVVDPTIVDGVIFDSMVPSMGLLDLHGKDKKNTLNVEIALYVNGELNTVIHTSCSQPIGPGMTFGDFYVVEGTSRNGGLLCPETNEPPETPTPPPPEECGCEGKVDYLKLQFLGSAEADVVVKQRKVDDPTIVDGVIFAETVPSMGEFELFGKDKKGTLNVEIEVYVDGELNTLIHTSCSQDIGPGMIFGDFLVLAGTSREGGPLCDYN